MMMYVEEGKVEFANCERVTLDGVLDLSSRQNSVDTWNVSSQRARDRVRVIPRQTE